MGGEDEARDTVVTQVPSKRSLLGFHLRPLPQYRVQSELRGIGRRAPNRYSVNGSLSRPTRQPRPEPRGELPVHYIQVQIIGPRVQHPEALGP